MYEPIIIFKHVSKKPQQLIYTLILPFMPLQVYLNIKRVTYYFFLQISIRTE